MTGGPDEFDLIATLFAPLSRGFPGALDLTDDAALMQVPAGEELVVTVDAMVAGVHFLADDPADLVARKLIRVNLSDLAAKGAAPVGVLLAAAFPAGVTADWLGRFAAGLGEDLAHFGIALIGGDTVATPGPLTLSLTAFGRVPVGSALLRRGARAGDDIWVSGSLGDGALGLLAAQAALPDLGADDNAWLADRYRLPRPRTNVGPNLIGMAHAGMDISDGLVQDLGHLCRASGLAAEIEAARLPLSRAAARALEFNQTRLASVLEGGDDYELLFTAAPGRASDIAALGERTGVALTRIGRMVPGSGVSVLAADGSRIETGRGGWRHFRG